LTRQSSRRTGEVDVYAIHRGLAGGSLALPDHTAALEEIRHTQLIPRLEEEDLGTPAWAWQEAADTL